MVGGGEGGGRGRSASAGRVVVSNLLTFFFQIKNSIIIDDWQSPRSTESTDVYTPIGLLFVRSSKERESVIFLLIDPMPVRVVGLLGGFGYDS